MWGCSCAQLLGLCRTWGHPFLFPAPNRTSPNHVLLLQVTVAAPVPCSCLLLFAVKGMLLLQLGLDPTVGHPGTFAPPYNLSGKSQVQSPAPLEQPGYLSKTNWDHRAIQVSKSHLSLGFWGAISRKQRSLGGRNEIPAPLEAAGCLFSVA